MKRGTFGEAVAQGATDSLSGVRVVQLMSHGSEKRRHPPAILPPCPLVIEGNYSSVVVFRHLTDGAAASDAGQGDGIKEGSAHPDQADQELQGQDRPASNTTDANQEPVSAVSESSTTSEQADRPPDLASADGATPEIRNFFTLEPSEAESIDIAEGSAGNELRPNFENGLSGRRGEAKEGLIRRGGGTDATEGAVKLGLDWLARNQQEDGLWSLTGTYADGGSVENHAAATAMALIAFQGAGHTHEAEGQSRYTINVIKGSKALIEHIQAEGKSYRQMELHGGYTRALCTIALCELYGMTKDRKLRRPAQDAVNYCIEAQSAEGGWRYTPRLDSDTSVTGWFVMALQSARMAELQVPKQTFGRVSAYLDGAATPDGSRYSYQQGGVGTRSMTAEALLCRQYLGWGRDDRRLLTGADYLLEELPNWQRRNVYYWYYATQVLHHLGDPQWERWNHVVRELLPGNQEKRGDERGSWDPDADPYGSAGGRLYVTCLCLYMLEVYYRHMPLYQDRAANAATSR